MEIRNLGQASGSLLTGEALSHCYTPLGKTVAMSLKIHEIQSMILRTHKWEKQHFKLDFVLGSGYLVQVDWEVNL